MGTSAALLEAVAGNAAGTSILVEDELIIGRHTQGAGRLGDDEEISRTHARVTVDTSNFCAIEDLGSTNGTFVNGLRISSPQILAEGDTIELGGTTLIVRELPKAETAAPEPAAAPEPVAEAPAEAAPASATIVSEIAAVGTEPETEPMGTESEAAPVGTEPEAAPMAAELETAPVGTEPFLPDSPPARGRVSLRLEIDFDARSAQVELDDGAEPLHLHFDGSAWRSEKGPA